MSRTEFRNTHATRFRNEYLYAYRRDNRLTLAAMAERVGTTRSAYWQYENSWIYPSDSLALRLSIITETPVDKLFPSAARLNTRSQSASWRKLRVKHRAIRDAFVLCADVYDLVGEPNADIDVEEEVEARLLVEKIVDLIPTLLTPRQQFFINLRFGLDGRAEMALEDVGATIGMSREIARLDIERALNKLRGAIIAAREPLNDNSA